MTADLSQEKAGPASTAGRPISPAQAWAELRSGNDRFVAGTPDHPNQNAARRGEIAGGQAPFAVFFGCGDSRVAAEVIFDQGLGDLFVVRTAGHILSDGVLGSLEFAVEELSVPLIVVLGHDSCGAVKAAIRHYNDASMPKGYIRDIVERVTPSVISAHRAGATTTDEVEVEHVRQTLHLIYERSQLIRNTVDRGSCAIIGLTYALAEGHATVVDYLGTIVE
ncbi:carbonic anhydrase [Austwickia chelonae]|uniref:Carbonic anhydrase n=1 Tax=Austwickia chelonae NBRC 105200 TaxID=1184607 RepID=K6VN43_9MICO|nr:carbonic anhydrase [Austwickia chelonae]GAB78134.1 putative carbonic anhydrase [Austwickia chelonae NBRC 105200]SEV97318.1 carbonic anhydrase [Austwickia chelonae]